MIKRTLKLLLSLSLLIATTYVLLTMRGELYLPSLHYRVQVQRGIDEEGTQDIIDEDYLAAQWSRYIGDHAYQGFDVIEKLTIGDTVYYNGNPYSVVYTGELPDYTLAPSTVLVLCTCHGDGYWCVGLTR